MGESTKIEWTSATFNPWWGCTRVAKGCEHCYAEAFAKRTGHKVWGVESERRFFADKHWRESLKWDAEAAEEGASRFVFCASMADVFEDRDDLVPHRARLFDLIHKTPNLIWQLLTKRPENVTYLSEPHGEPMNVWIGASAATQAELDRNVEHLVDIKLRWLKFVSLEPLIEAVRLPTIALNDMLEWVIVGGESGGRARPFDLLWAASLIDQCEVAAVDLFFKQAGSNPTHGGLPLRLKDPKGGDLSELPARFHVRQRPEASR